MIDSLSDNGSDGEFHIDSKSYDIIQIFQRGTRKTNNNAAI